VAGFPELMRPAGGKKAVMAVTGLILFGFVLGHFAGNLKLYQGPRALNDYPAFLRTAGSPELPAGALLWTFRSVLLASLALHVWAAWQLTRMSHPAPPARYLPGPLIPPTHPPPVHPLR